VRVRRLSDIAAAVGGRLVGSDAEASSVAIDSRTVEQGSLFVALRGDRTDGHDFVAEAGARGAAGAIVEQPTSEISAIAVDDSARALLDLAADERASLTATVIGITGSTGKTTTKDLTAAVLSGRFSVRASPASFNNEVGVPLTILGADERTEALVCEMGSRGIGHIAMLCAVARPHIGIVTNVGVAHLELFGSRENVVRAKGELVEALPDEGVAILNADDEAVRSYRSRTRARTLTYGFAPDADVRAVDVTLDDEARASFVLAIDGDRERVELSVAGEHMVTNALAAATCGAALGITPAETASALKGARVSAWRMETFVTPDGVRVINDAYNANPHSMAAALQTARVLARDSRLLVVLGHMAELGPISQEEHLRLGELVARLEVDRLLTVGADARDVQRAAVREGLAMRDAVHIGTAGEALDDLRANVRPGDVVLIKASRVAGLERIAEALRTGATP
jgi:UDP-N-acetylmuramoyl-tripeptide--D-alanyl-D-alanine ligase